MTRMPRIPALLALVIMLAGCANTVENPPGRDGVMVDLNARKLHLQAQMSFRQIAEAQDVSINTVMSQYRYGLQKLRSLLNGELEP